LRRLNKISIICNKNLKGIDKTNDIKFIEGTKDVKIGIINLMPFKDEIEMQFFTILGRYDLKVEIEFLYPETHITKNTPMNYIKENYYPIKDIKKRNYNGIIITGAPLEEIEFEKVRYWDEIKDVFDLDIPTINICWASQAGLYKSYGIKKYPLEQKKFGIYNHQVNLNSLITQDNFMAPHSRNTYNKKSDILFAGLDIIAESEDAGVYISATKDLKKIYISGHGEYQKNRLEYEYLRDLKEIPVNYFKDNDPKKEILFTWDPHRKELYKNWLEGLVK